MKTKETGADRRLRKLQPYHGSVTIETAHDVRKLRACVCGGLGMVDSMIHLKDGRFAHGRCYIKRWGINAFYELPSKQTGRLPLTDIGTKAMKRLVAQSSSSTPPNQVGQ